MKTELDNYKELNKSLIKSTLALEEAQEIGKFGHWELDISSGNLYWSKQIYSIFKLSSSVFTPNYEAFLNVIHPDDRDFVNKAYTKSLKDKTLYEIEHRLLYEDGTIAYVAEKCKTFYDENGYAIKSIGTIQDITERVIYEQKLKESEQKFKAISNQASEGVTVADMEGNYEFVNPAFCNMSGYTEEELLSMTVFDMKAKNQNHASFAESKEKMVGLPIRVNLRKKDGTEYLTEIIGDVITVNNRKLVLGTIRDITQQEKAEQEIKKLNTNLELLVKARTEELNKTILDLNIEVEKRKVIERKIQESLHVKEILLKEITHRVKNNLQIISSLITLQKGTIINEESIELLTQTANRIHSMALIHETLYKSKEFDQIKFNTYINSLINYITRTFDTSQISILTDVDDFSLSIDAATSCGMIIMELITNSVKYAFHNIPEPIIHISMKNMVNNQFKLTIADNGIGFPKDLDFKTTKSLGMQVIVSLTEQLDGTINLINKEGTTFEIIIQESIKKTILLSGN